jgi:hypothetical protein
MRRDAAVDDEGTCMKRRLLKLGVFLLLGAIVNVAAAWGCALGVDVYAGVRQLGSVPGWRVVRDEQPGALHVYVTRFPNNGGNQEPRGTHPSGLQPFWLGQPTPVTLPDGREWHTSRIADARGVPLLAMWSEQPRDKPSGDPWDMIDAPVWGGIKTSLTPWRMPGGVPVSRILPLRPIWHGFAINSIIYATILWLLCIAAGAVRRFVRVRQHRCPACGFIIAPGTCANGLCSECGATLPRRLLRPATPAAGGGETGTAA